VELYVSDINRALAFWTGPLGFTIAYQRPEDGFAYLERFDGPLVMLYQADAQRGGMCLQLFIADIDAVAARLGPQIEDGPREVWRRWGDVMGGKREITVRDPDGFLVLLAQDNGTRPL